jgi:uncharacterized protein YoxC
LQNQYNKIAAQTKRLKKRLDGLKNKKKALRADLEKREQAIDTYAEAVDAMALIQASKTERRKMVRQADDVLARYKLSATSVEQNGSKSMAIEILIPFKEREKAARFMADMVKLGYKGVETKKIELDKDLYKSRVEIVR